jgi:Fe-Mn family superoxide dismutase
VLLVNLETLPEAVRTPVRRHGGGHVNHSMFWQVMSPDGGGEPGGALAEAINRTFGDFASFRQEMSSAASNRFGSGWGWLAATPEGQLVTLNTPNQNSPYLGGLIPLLGIDVWEHAYYLKYQNRRGEYIDAWWNTVNWPAVEQRFATLMG